VKEMNKGGRNMSKRCPKYDVKVKKTVEPVLIMNG
jgi:hypothetical protein